LVPVVVVGLSLFSYDYFVIRPALKIGVVDVGEVYRLKEAEFTQAITKASSADERDKALAMARQFARQLPMALEDLPHECHCIVMVRSALVGTPPHAVDLTNRLKQKVELP
jgi:hypothetical protein